MKRILTSIDYILALHITNGRSLSGSWAVAGTKHHVSFPWGRVMPAHDADDGTILYLPFAYHEHSISNDRYHVLQL